MLWTVKTSPTRLDTRYAQYLVQVVARLSISHGFTGFKCGLFLKGMARVLTTLFPLSSCRPKSSRHMSSITTRVVWALIVVSVSGSSEYYIHRLSPYNNQVPFSHSCLLSTMGISGTLIHWRFGEPPTAGACRGQSWTSP